MAWHYEGALRNDQIDALRLGVGYFTDRLNVSQFEESKSLSREAYVRMIDHMDANPTRFADELVLGDARERL